MSDVNEKTTFCNDTEDVSECKIINGVTFFHEGLPL